LKDTIGTNRVPYLSLNECLKVTKFNQPMQNQSTDLSGLLIKEIPSYYSQLKELVINDCCKLSKILGLSEIFCLLITECSHLKIIKDLTKIQKIKISFCSRLKNIQVLKNIYFLSIHACLNLKVINQLVDVKEVITDDKLQTKHFSNEDRMEEFSIFTDFSMSKSSVSEFLYCRAEFFSQMRRYMPVILDVLFETYP
jgi:hypothetical protein